jgi:hypothetical protein
MVFSRVVIAVHIRVVIVTVFRYTPVIFYSNNCYRMVHVSFNFNPVRPLEITETAVPVIVHTVNNS